MDIQWGIGIEHEVLTYFQGDTVTGKHLSDNLTPHLYGLRKYISDFIIPTSYYASYTSYNLDINRLKILPPGVVLPSKTKTLLLAYFHLYLDHDVSDWQDAQLVREFVSTLDTDGTNLASVFEFKNRQWANYSITNSVEQVKLEQYLTKAIINLSPNYLTRPVEYAKYGSMFPIYSQRTSKYWLDYTGSYHLNLSLPYSVAQLTQERLEYESIHDMIQRKYKSALVQLLSANTVDSELANNPYQGRFNMLSTPSTMENILTRIPEITETLPSVILNKIQTSYRQTINKYADSNLNQILLGTTSVIPNLVFKLLIRTQSTRVACFYYHHPTGLLDKVFTERINSPADSPISQLGESLVGLLVNRNLLGAGDRSTHLFTLNSDYTKVVEIPSVGLSNKYVRLLFTENSNLSANQVITLPKLSFPLGLTEQVTTMLRDSTEQKLIDILRGSFNNISTAFNLHHKYEPNGFHRLHKQWAIGIQWVIPLILSCYSSADPFSIGDNNKLSELSLRLFVSGFNLINLTDIMRFELPDTRERLPWQWDSKLIQNSKHLFMYDNVEFEGSEFRVDSGHGFNFGFELRVFDNFDIEEIEPLLEFLFLLADQIANQGTIFTKNPFTSKVLNNTIIQILKQGWNTKISNKYRDLLNQQLGLAIPTVGEMTSYVVANHIYQQLQHLFMDTLTGKGTGPYTQYVINRSPGLRNLPNINRQSWEHHFTNLIWNPTPKTPIRKIIEKEIYAATDRRDLINRLLHKLPSGYRDDILDVVYALETLGITATNSTTSY